MKEADLLIWSLLDGDVEQTDLARLHTLLTRYNQVRRHYLQCVEIHNHLQCFFASEKDASPT